MGRILMVRALMAQMASVMLIVILNVPGKLHEDSTIGIHGGFVLSGICVVLVV